MLVWIPLSIKDGDNIRDRLQTVRVELVRAPWNEPPRPPKTTSRPNGTTSLPRPELPKPASQTKKPQAVTLSRTKVAKALRVSPKPRSPNSTTKQPVAKQQRTDTARNSAPPAKTTVVKTAKDDIRTNPASSAPKSRQVPNNDHTKAAQLARSAPRGKLTEESPKPPLIFSPVRYAETRTPRYPGKARRAGWQGTTVLKVLVDSKGDPGQVTLDRTSGFDILDVAAMRAIRHWKFHPAHKGITAVPSWIRIPVAFRLREDQQ